VQAIRTTEETRRVQQGFTEAQRDILVAAVKTGYFEIPRETSLTDLADQRNESHQAVSEHLRLTTYNLVELTLIAYSTAEDE
jgi:predicted DNA binding protein